MTIIVDESRELPEKRPCPVCGEILDGVTQVGDRGAYPKPGDLSFCLYCGAPLEFTEDGFRVLSNIEVIRLDASNLDYRRARQAVRQVVAERKREQS